MYFLPWNQSPYSAKLCINHEYYKIDVEIANLNPNYGFTLARNDCERELLSIYITSPYGGENQNFGWWFR